MPATLFYVHDPMCSWCWGFAPSWHEISKQATNVNIQLVLGGLAPDSSDPMPSSMQLSLQQTWRRIEQVIPGTTFNHDFWTVNSPRRSTYPACRAVIAAKLQNPENESLMIGAIQQAYYADAKNPSDDVTLIDLAEQIGCDRDRFSTDLNSEATQAELRSQIHFARLLGAQGFPSMFLESDTGQRFQLPVDYTQPCATLDAIEHCLAS